ncbi:MAG: Ca2+-transporting ATPase, partial [Myxococcota bacterium]
FDNPLLWAAAAVTVAMQILVVHLAFLNRAFDTVPLDTRQWGICIALSSAVLFADEIRKVVQRSICRRRETGRLNSATVDI